MNLISSTGGCGLVLDSEGRDPLAREEPQRDEAKAHFILKRYRIDDDGYICLTPSLPLSELPSSVDVLKAELDSLLAQVEKRFPKRRVVLPLR